MAEVNNFKTSKRKKPLDIQYVYSVTRRPSDLAIPSARKSKGRGGAVQSFEMKTDGDLEAMILRFRKSIMTIGHKLPDKGEKVKATLRQYVAEVQRRKRSRVVKDEREEEDDEVKRMGRLRDELDAEKKQANQVKGELIDAETKIVQLEAYVLNLQKQLRDSWVQLDASEEEKKELAKRLDVAERKCASVADDSNWLLKEGLSFLVKKLVNELSKENFMTVSQLRTLHQRSMSDSS